MPIRHLLAEITKRRSGLLGDDSKLVPAKLGNEILDKHSHIFALRKDIVKPGLCGAPIPLSGGARLNSSMNKHECRKQWLHSLIEKEGTVNALASKIGTDPNYISSIVGPNAKRELGDDVAKRIEEIYSLPQGVLDLPSEGAQRVAMASEGLSPGDIEDVLKYIEFKKSTKNWA